MTAAGRAAPGTLAGILLVAASGVMLASMDAMGKHLAVRLEVLQVVWARYAVHTVVVFVWLLLRQGSLRFLRTRRPAGQFLRSLNLLGVTACMYTALVFVPLADATAVMFFAPVLVTVLAGLFLGEEVGPHRIAAVVMGFAGVLVIVRPGFGADPAMLLPLGAAVMLSGYLLITRWMSERDHRAATVFYSTAFGSVALTLAVPWFWQTPTLPELGMMLAMGLLGALGHGCIVLGFSRAPASVLSPFLYMQLLAATVISVTAFGDPLSVFTLLGAVLLVGGGLVIWWWEGVLARRARHRARGGRSDTRAV